VITALFFRACEGCGRQVPTDEWQDGRLGCAGCRLRYAAVEAARVDSPISEREDEAA
jgi:hypothetical protein